LSKPPPLKYNFHFRGNKLDNKDFLSKSDPFFILYAAKDGRTTKATTGIKVPEGSENKDWVSVYRSEVINNDLNPVWKPFSLSLQTLCKGSTTTHFLIEVYDWESNGNHDFIGSTEIFVQDHEDHREVRLINKKRHGIGNVAGTLQVIKCQPEV